MDVTIQSFENIYRKEKPVTWINNKFKSIEEIFPNWFMARFMLGEFCDKTKGWVYSRKTSHLEFGLSFPLVKDEISGEVMSMISFFPEEYRALVNNICSEVMVDYFPDISDLYGENLNNLLMCKIMDRIKCREDFIVISGGKKIIDELRFRFGLYGGLKYLKIECNT